KDFFIDEAPLREILALGREAAAPELEKVVNDVLEGFDPDLPDGKEPAEDDWYRHFYFLHALYLLDELDAEESLPLLLKLLRKDHDFLEYWFGDYLYEEVPDLITKLGRNQLPALMEAVNDSGLSLHSRHLVDKALLQIAVLHPGKRPDIIGFYRQYLRNVLGHADAIEEAYPEDEDESYGLDVYTYLGFLLSDLQQVNAIELESEIRQCYRQELVDESITGGEEDIEFRDGEAILYESIFERYEAMKEWPGDDSPFNPDAENIRKRKALEKEKERLQREKELKKQAEKDRLAQKYAPQPVASSALKVERNDPCPCGSGKKYKKCCMP
ncbi:MAG: DUF1186 domain-containing protein, partial [Cytophagales bacterium]|nr:DUF1186 domain-containing protein [Cytophagales bacterium]